ncbi:MAG: DUF1385 domain-containing protein, partial [Solirubrobacteraceae bacterium]
MSVGGDQKLTAARDAPVGGQAVLEGVMMRGVAHWAVAVRKPAEVAASGEAEVAASGEAEDRADSSNVAREQEPVALGEIVVRTFALASRLGRHRAYRLPVIRGVVALAESLGIGLRALSFSANAQLPGEQEQISSGAW